MEKRFLKEAIKIANNNGHSGASFLGIDNGKEVYLGEALDKEGRPLMVGLPFWITFEPDGTSASGFGFEYMHLVKE